MEIRSENTAEIHLFFCKPYICVFVYSDCIKINHLWTQNPLQGPDPNIHPSLWFLLYPFPLIQLLYKCVCIVLELNTYSVGEAHEEEEELFQQNGV